MMIQENMASRAIVDVWPETESVFNRYHITLSSQPLNRLSKTQEHLTQLVQELNHQIGSSDATCTDGG